MNKFLATLAFAGVAAAGTIGTLNESKAEAPKQDFRGSASKILINFVPFLFFIDDWKPIFRVIFVKN